MFAKLQAVPRCSPFCDTRAPPPSLPRGNRFAWQLVAADAKKRQWAQIKDLAQIQIGPSAAGGDGGGWGLAGWERGGGDQRRGSIDYGHHRYSHSPGSFGAWTYGGPFEEVAGDAASLEDALGLGLAAGASRAGWVPGTGRTAVHVPPGEEFRRRRDARRAVKKR